MGGDDARPIKVLVADKAKLVRLFIIDLLNEGPFPVDATESNDGTDACRQLLSGNFDLAFLDVEMPGIDGLSALELLHRMKSDTVVIICSSASDPEKLIKARRFGAYEFLQKPFTMKRFDGLLRAFQQVRAPHRALIVDDSGVVRGIVQKLLTRSLFNVSAEEAGDGRLAIEVCKDRPFDFVLLDVVMPEVSGIDVLREIRAAGVATKVILMTADREFAMTEQIKALDVATTLFKPFTQHEIDKTLHDIFRIKPPLLSSLPTKAGKKDAERAA